LTIVRRLSLAHPAAVLRSSARAGCSGSSTSSSSWHATGYSCGAARSPETLRTGTPPATQRATSFLWTLRLVPGRAEDGGQQAGSRRAAAPRQQAVAQTLGNRTTSCAVRIVHAASQRFPSHHTGRIGRRVQLFRKTDSMYSTGYTPHGAPLRTALIRHPEASDKKDTHVSPTALDHTLFRGCRRARIAILRSFSVKAPSLHAPRHKMSGDSSRSATLAPFPVSRG
jgi:hypothetical protein